MGVGAKDTDLKASSLDLLDTNHLQRQQLVQRHDGVHHHFGKEVLLIGNELGVQGRGCTSLQELPLLSEATERGNKMLYPEDLIIIGGRRRMLDS